MANCVQCGRELPSLGSGEIGNYCPGCRFQQQQEQATAPQPLQRRASPGEQMRAFPVTAAIVAINTAVYLACVAGAYASHRGSAMNFTTNFVLGWGANYGPLTLDGQWWRLFTCMWLHGGLIHVGSNMYCFWDFGRIAERIFGRSRYLAIYLITGIGASLASLSWHPNTISVGASGAIFGVAGALFVTFFHKRLKLAPPVMSSMLRSIGIFIVINLVIGASISFIDNSAHVGGLVVGLLLGEVFVRLAGPGAESSLWKVVAASALLMASGFFVIRQKELPRALAIGSIQQVELGNLPEEKRLAQRALAMAPDLPETHVALGELSLGQQKYPEALSEYQAALRLAPGDSSLSARIQFINGAALASQGKYQEALPAFREAQRLDPDEKEYQQALQQAEQQAGGGKK
jgi:rhomboid protease GluP